MNARLRLAEPHADEPCADASVPSWSSTTTPAKRLALQGGAGCRSATRSSRPTPGWPRLRCVMAQDFAVILLDVRMPIMDGFETAALIRQRRQSEMTPIIFITAHGERRDRDTDRYAEGAVDFIFAPVPPEELRAKVSVFANLFIKAEALAAQAREVQASADQLRLLTDAAPIGIFQTDADDRYVYTNPRWTEITGISSQEAFGRSWDTIVSSEKRAGLDQRVVRGCCVDATSSAIDSRSSFRSRHPGSCS